MVSVALSDTHTNGPEPANSLLIRQAEGNFGLFFVLLCQVEAHRSLSPERVFPGDTPHPSSHTLTHSSTSTVPHKHTSLASLANSCLGLSQLETDVTRRTGAGALSHTHTPSETLGFFQFHFLFSEHVDSRLLFAALVPLFLPPHLNPHPSLVDDIF